MSEATPKVKPCVENFRPLRDYVLAKRVTSERTEGGIYLADPSKSGGSPWLCEVLKVGPGDFLHGEFHATCLEPGDLIYTGPYAGYVQRLGSEDYVLCREFADVLGALEAPEEAA